MVKGFRGVEEISKLFCALAQARRSEDNLSLFLNCDQSYELFVAEKALKGTFTILDNFGPNGRTINRPRRTMGAG